MENIGIFGGTFNPIHKAHIHIANEFISQLELNKCYFIPAKISPFKTDIDRSNQDIMHIVNMLEIVLKNNSKFEICDIELKSKEISYSYRTVKYFKKLYPKSKLYFLIGGDHINSFEKWKHWEYIIKNARLCIAGRPNTFTDDDKMKFDSEFSIEDLSPIWLNSNEIDMSSSDIRKAVRDHVDISEHLIPQVYEYIMANDLYSD